MHATDCESGQEQKYGNSIDPADRVAGNQFAEEKLGSADDQCINTAVPADILEEVEFA